MKRDHFAAFFKQDEFSDADVIIQTQIERQQEDKWEQPPGKRTRCGSQHAANEGVAVLATIPAHRVVLAGTDYFKAQSQAWASGSGSTAAAAGLPEAACERPQLRLTIDHAGQLPAAEAVLGALYFDPDAMSSLEPQQLVNAAMLADKMGAAAVAEQAVQKLQTAAEHGLPATALEALASLPAWPACMLPLLLPVLQRASCCDVGLARDLAAITAADTGNRVQRMLLVVLGDLETVWRDGQLQQLLMTLPLPALQLLLSSDQLRVASEDTVLYTASEYAAAQPFNKAAAARTALAPLVRVPHLSRFALSCQVFGTDAEVLLSSYKSQLQLLASYKLITEGASTPAAIVEEIEYAPASWSLGKRQLGAANDVQLVWRLPVEQLAQACRDSFAGSRDKHILSPASTPPIGAVSWTFQLTCRQEEDKDGMKGTLIDVYAMPQEVPAGVLRAFTCTLTGHSTSHRSDCSYTPGGYGFSDFFKLGCMSSGGGWDEAAWAAKGLPTSGELELSLHMHSVGA